MAGAGGATGATPIQGSTPASGGPSMWQQFLGQGEGVMGLLESPAFNIGMGLLQHRADKSKTIAQAILGGMTTAQKQALGADKREREENLRQQLDEFFKNQKAMTPQGAATPTGTLVPTGQTDSERIANALRFGGMGIPGLLM